MMPQQATVSGTILAQGATSTGFTVCVNGPTDVVARQLTIPAGTSLNWHFHPGPLIAVIMSGTLTHVQADGTIKTMTAGHAFLEPPGENRIHRCHNLGPDPLILHATYLLPHGSPLAIDVPPPRTPGTNHEPATTTRPVAPRVPGQTTAMPFTRPHVEERNASPNRRP